MAVRAYKDTDFPAICHIYIDAKQDELKAESFDVDVLSLSQDALILAAFHESDVLVFEDENVVGFAARFGGELRALFVHGSARGRGVGQALLDAVTASAPRRMSLNVAKSNSGARRFYEKNGFSSVAEVVKRYNGNDVAYVTMSN
jgi:putative acetyltransferase